MTRALILFLTLCMTTPLALAQDTDSGTTASGSAGDEGGAPSCAVIPSGSAVMGLVVLSLLLGRRAPE